MASLSPGMVDVNPGAVKIMHMINGKPLAECSDADLHAEWEGGMYLDCTVGLTEEQSERVSAIEKEMDRRHPAVS